MKATFEECIEVILKHEGGYVNDPDDLGGETKFGITKRTFPNEDIKNLTKERAIFLYKKFFWDKFKIEQYPLSLRLSMFDMSVNMGNKNAIKVLQRSLGVKDDGIAGAITLGKLDEIEFVSEFIGNLTMFRVKYYITFAIKNPRNTKFLNGWISRTHDILLTTFYA